MTRSSLKDFIEDKQVIEEILKPHNRLIMVMGAADTGKTTLVECIADITSRKTTTAIVDLDMGQSHIGLPTTVGWGMVYGGFKDWKDILLADFYFTGTLSPPGGLVPALVGARLMTERAMQSCQKVIIDTTGLISGPSGRVLKQFKIDLLCPHIILALERSEELKDILQPFRNQVSINIQRLQAPSMVKTKSVERRSQYRLDKFRSYFMNTPITEISYNDKGIRFISAQADSLWRTEEPSSLICLDESYLELKDMVISFRDDKNRDIALGIIEGIDTKDGILLIRTPLRELDRVSIIMVGVTRVTP